MAARNELESMDRLGVLRAVVEAGSFLKAGQALGLSQPAVSRAVAKLEAGLGVRLFQRTARASVLTDEGRAYYDAIAPHLHAIEQASRAVSASRDRVRGRLKVNLDPGTAQYLVAPHLDAFFAQHPDLRIELVVSDRLGDFAADGLDVAVRVGNPRRSALKARLLRRCRVVTCAAPAYLARCGTPRRPEDVARHRCLLMRDPVRAGAFAWELVQGSKVVALEAKGPLLVNHFGPMLAACVAGQGLAQFLDFHVEPLLASGALVQLFRDWPDETYPLYAYHQASPQPSARVRAFLDFLEGVTRR